MKTVIIVQARMGSTRLPNKVMKKIVGVPTIGIILKRLKKIKKANKVIVATSNKKENLPLLEYLKKIKASYFCGKEDDVLNRFYQVASKYKAKIIVRITADCPLVDVKIVDEFIKKFKKNKPDYLSNCAPWTYPDGLDVEVFSYELLKKVERKATKSQREEGGVILRYLRDNPNSINSINITCPIKKLPKYRLCVDEEIELRLWSNDKNMELYVDANLDIGVFGNSPMTSGSITVENAPAVPVNFFLSQNYPNPFNPETTIEYVLPENGMVTLQVFDITGRIVSTLVNDYQESGYYNIIWNSKDDRDNIVSAGVYIYTIQTDKSTLTRKMVLMK